MQKEKTLTLFDMFGMAVSAFVSMELIASMSELGPSIVISFLVIGGLYVFSHCVICAELGSTYPEQGGIYVWVKRGLGDKWAARTNWWYWLNVVGFVPSVMIPTISIFKQLFWPNMSLAVLTVLCVVFTWLIMFFNMLPLKESKLLTTLGMIAKIVFCAFLIGAGGYVFFSGSSQVTFTAETIMPKLDMSLIALIPVFVYGLSGMDMIGCAADEMHNPQKDMPRAMIITTLVAIILYILSTLAVEIILPLQAIDKTTGLIDSIIVVFGASKFAIIMIGVCLALVYFGNAFAWPLAANKAAMEAANAGEFPKVFSKTNKYGSPVGGAIVMGISSSLLIIFYGIIANSNEGLFWTILAFTAIVFFMPYIMMTFAFLKLRKTDANTVRPFKVPGKKLPTVVGAFHLLLLLGSCVSFLIPRDGKGVMYVVVLLSTLIGSQIVGEIIVHKSIKNNKDKSTN